MPEINKRTDEELLEIVHRVKQADEEYLKGEKVENDAVQRNIDASRSKWINVNMEELDQIIATTSNSNFNGLWDQERCPDSRVRLLHNRQVLKNNSEAVKAKKKMMGENNNPVRFK